LSPGVWAAALALAATPNFPALSHRRYLFRYLPFDAVTGETDTAAANADGSVYTNPK
jgi:hypothetical protein